MKKTLFIVGIIILLIVIAAAALFLFRSPTYYHDTLVRCVDDTAELEGSFTITIAEETDVDVVEPTGQTYKESNQIDLGEAGNDKRCKAAVNINEGVASFYNEAPTDLLQAVFDVTDIPFEKENMQRIILVNGTEQTINEPIILDGDDVVVVYKPISTNN